MASLHLYLSLLFLVSYQLPLITSSNLSDCPPPFGSTYQCGNLTLSSLSYPFTTSDDPFCNGLRLDCDHNNNTILTMQLIDRPSSFPFQVLGFDNRTQTITLNPVKTNSRHPTLCDPHYDGYFSIPSTRWLSFTILNGIVHLRCKSNPNLKGRPEDYCHDISYVYGPYNTNISHIQDFVSKKLTEKDRWSVLPVTKFTLRYQLEGPCNDCTQKGGWCRDTDYSKDFCVPNENHNGKELAIILGSVLGVVVLVLAAFILLAFWHRRRIKQDSYSTKHRTLDSDQSDLETGSVFLGVPVFSYDDLKEATDNFNSTKELGEGGFGTVYYGKLKDGREVAVKRLYEKNYKQIEQFMNEIQILTCLHHKNLVTLYGCTSRRSRHLLLVYEFIAKGTLADHLHGDKSEAKSLTWPIRMKIAIETASALSYLHASDIIHRDVKTNNILLDNHFTVKVADFGLCRLFPTDVTHVSTAPQGTPGYVDPEYHQCYHLTSKSDVYSFGVVLIELISSLPAVDIDRHRHEINLSTYAMNRIQCGDIHELIDPSLGFDTDYKVKRMIMLVAELAFQCLQQEREIRPSMDEVLEKLKRIESVDYDLSREEEMERESSTKQQPPSPSEQDDIGLLESVQHLPPSPDSVMKEWVSKSTTPNTSAKEF